MKVELSDHAGGASVSFGELPLVLTVDEARRVSPNVDVATSSRGDCCAVLTQDRAGPFQLRPGLGRVTQYRAHDLPIDRGVALNHPLSRLAVGVIALQVRRGGETCGVEGARHLVGIGTVEFDLKAESLVGIPDHVLPLVLAAGSPGELEQLAMKLVVGCQRPLAFRHLGALGLEELVPELLGLGLLEVAPLAFVAVAFHGPRVDIGPLGGVDGGVFDVRHK